MDKAILFELHGSTTRQISWPEYMDQSFIESLEPGEYFMRYRIETDTFILRRALDCCNYAPPIEYTYRG